MRSMTKFELFWLSEYLVGAWLVGSNIQRFIEFVMSVRKSLWIEWYKKLKSQILSLILKSPIIINMLLILALVFFEYFKAVCNKSE